MTFQTKNIQLLFLTCVVFLLFRCHYKDNLSVESITHIKSPAGQQSSVPNLYVDKYGLCYLTWIEMVNDSLSSLNISTFHNQKWSEKKEITSGENWFVNWADFPSLTSFAEKHLAAHYLAKKEGGTYAYDVHIVLSKDRGQTWSEPIIPHRDSTATEHGFVSLLPYQDQLMAIWLDGRHYEIVREGDSLPSDEMSLRAALIDTNGVIVESYVIDDRVCSCCQTDAILGPNGPILVYRDRSQSEIRDISVTHFLDGQWSDPTALHPDGWEIGGCPVNGPAIDAKDSVIAVAWYTEANQKMQVFAAFSTDAGQTFSAPMMVCDSTTIGRLDITLTTPDKAIIIYLENVDGETKIMASEMDRTNGNISSFPISNTSVSRSSGFPMVAKQNQSLLFAWTDNTGDSPMVKTAITHLD